MPLVAGRPYASSNPYSKRNSAVLVMKFALRWMLPQVVDVLSGVKTPSVWMQAHPLVAGSTAAGVIIETLLSRLEGGRTLPDLPRR